MNGRGNTSSSVKSWNGSQLGGDSDNRRRRNEG
jgi:hypothetical protein